LLVLPFWRTSSLLVPILVTCVDIAEYELLVTVPPLHLATCKRQTRRAICTPREYLPTCFRLSNCTMCVFHQLIGSHCTPSLCFDDPFGDNVVGLPPSVPRWLSVRRFLLNRRFEFLKAVVSTSAQRVFFLAALLFLRNVQGSLNLPTLSASPSNTILPRRFATLS